MMVRFANSGRFYDMTDMLCHQQALCLVRGCIDTYHYHEKPGIETGRGWKRKSAANTSIKIATSVKEAQWEALLERLKERPEGRVHKYLGKKEIYVPAPGELIFPAVATPI